MIERPAPSLGGAGFAQTTSSADQRLDRFEQRLNEIESKYQSDLKARDPAWGLRCLEDVQAEAASAGLALRERVDMPANNLLVLFEREPAAQR